jgi:ABC-2 type transport system ATP-binding protein
MYEVDMLCDHVGIINQGVLAAFDTPQGLKDNILEEQKVEGGLDIMEIMRELEEESNVSDISSFHKLKGSMLESEIANAREISIKITNIDDGMMEILEKLPFVFEITPHRSGRVSLQISNSADAVTAVISTILKNEGNISSISTQDPSLEDVFMKVTSKKEAEGE